MGNGVSSDQGNLPSYGKRDVRRPADRKQHDWSELAAIPETNSLLAVANSYSSRIVVSLHYDITWYTLLHKR